MLNLEAFVSWSVFLVYKCLWTFHMLCMLGIPPSVWLQLYVAQLLVNEHITKKELNYWKTSAFVIFLIRYINEKCFKNIKNENKHIDIEKRKANRYNFKWLFVIFFYHWELSVYLIPHNDFGLILTWISSRLQSNSNSGLLIMFIGTIKYIWGK